MPESPRSPESPKSPKSPDSPEVTGQTSRAPARSRRAARATPLAEAAASDATQAASDAARADTARLPTALVYDPAFLEHRVPDGFPEEPERVRRAIAMIEALIDEGTLPREQVLRLAPRAATTDELTTVHTAAYVERVRSAVESLMVRSGWASDEVAELANEVYISPGSYTAATLAAGAALTALDAIGEGRARNGYALVRPPGHHARPKQAMGFCIFNNIAVAARYAQKRWGWQKVLIVDYDVHHGNGTQEAFYDDPNVTYFSTHQYPWYPGTGGSTEMGQGEGHGTTINVPLPPESGWSVYDPIFRQVLWPVADRFKPDVVLLSAGFDAHWKDPLGEMRLSTPDISDLTLECIEIADRYCGGRIVAVQEGGYHLDAMAQCAASVLINLTGSNKLVDDIGLAPPLTSRWNDEAIVAALYELHGLAGYRRKARREGRRIDPE